MTEMTYNEVIEWMDSRHWSGTGKGIVRSQELLERLGNPQDKLKFVHVAGTNGKGSVCACLSKILTAAGYQVGLFVSPHLKRFNDRIYFNGTEIGDEDFARLASCIRAQAEVMEDAPTVFEIMTAMGMLYFAEKQCDLVMLEVGMGGRLDSTNVIRTPEAAVITSIGLDHTKELGDTLEKIAGEKGGIIKTGGTVIVDGSNTAVMPVFEIAFAIYVTYLLMQSFFPENRLKALEGVCIYLFLTVVTSEKCGAIIPEWWLIVNPWTGKTIAFNIMIPLLLWGLFSLEDTKNPTERCAYWRVVFFVGVACCLIAASLYMVVPILFGTWGLFYLLRTHRWKEIGNFVICTLPTLACAIFMLC